jgi:HEAT repeat protein
MIFLGTIRYRRLPLAAWLLIRALSRSSVATRSKAARMLGDLKNRRSVPALTARLADNAPEVRCAAAWALGQIGEPCALFRLSHNAGCDPHPDVRDAAIMAIGRIAYPASAGFLIDLIQRNYHCESAVTALTQLLTVSRQRLCAKDLHAITSLENQALPASLLNDGDQSSFIGNIWRHTQVLATQELWRRQEAGRSDRCVRHSETDGDEYLGVG